jgi:hypothetical protein
MIAAIMQPYFFPYIGYFQLMRAVDLFVLYDDAQYSKGGWVNRNRIRGQTAPAWLTMPVSQGHLELPINRRHYALSGSVAALQMERRLRASYSTTPGFAEAFPLVAGLLGYGDSNVAAFNANLLVELARALDIRCVFASTSALNDTTHLKGKAKVIDLCGRFGIDHYVNSIGGVGLYDPRDFDNAGVQLSFLRTTAPPVDFTGGPQHLSIIDTLMHEGIAGSKAHLPQYQLLAADAVQRA